jgi:hypothetical protein
MALYLHDPKLIFVHIPKTGGMSIRQALMSKYGHVIDEVGKSHNSAADVIQTIGYDEWNSHVSFAVVRNPYDWAVSHYHFIHDSPEHQDHKDVKEMDFDDFILYLVRNTLYSKKTVTGVYQTQTDYVLSKYGGQFTTAILRFESLVSDWNWLCHAVLKIPTLPLRHINISKNRNHWTKYFKDEQIRKHFEGAFMRDFVHFNYKLV